MHKVRKEHGYMRTEMFVWRKWMVKEMEESVRQGGVRGTEKKVEVSGNIQEDGCTHCGRVNGLMLMQ